MVFSPLLLKPVTYDQQNNSRKVPVSGFMHLKKDFQICLTLLA